MDIKVLLSNNIQGLASMFVKIAKYVTDIQILINSIVNITSNATFIEGIIANERKLNLVNLKSPLT